MAAKTFSVINNNSVSSTTITGFVFTTPSGIQHVADLSNFGGFSNFTGNTFPTNIVLGPSSSLSFTVDYIYVSGNTGTRNGKISISTQQGEIAEVVTYAVIGSSAPTPEPPSPEPPAPTPPSSTVIITTTSPLPSGNVGVAYNQALSSTVGMGPYFYEIISGSLPSGLTMSSEGVISGTPLTSQSASFTVKSYSQPIGGAGPGTKAFTLSIAPALSVVITTASPLPSGTVGTAYSQSLTSTNGIGPYFYEIASGSLPSGLSLSGGGTISGTPILPQTASFVIRSYSGGGAGAGTKAFDLTIVANTTTGGSSGGGGGGGGGGGIIVLPDRPEDFRELL